VCAGVCAGVCLVVGEFASWWILALEVLAIISITTPETNKNTLKITERSNK